MLTDRDYQPNSATPLYDAMGNSLSKLRHQLNEQEKNQVLVTIITDGYENASKEYSGKMIKHLVEELKKSGWVFTYIGANQDVDAVAGSLSIENKIHFKADREGMNDMMAKERKSRDIFYSKVSAKFDDDSIDLQKKYFDEEDFDVEAPKNTSDEQSKRKSFFSMLKNGFKDQEKK